MFYNKKYFLLGQNLYKKLNLTEICFKNVKFTSWSLNKLYINKII